MAMFLLIFVCGIFGTAQRTRSLQNIPTVNVAGAIVSISDHIKLVGITLDSRLTFDTHISALSKSCYFHIRALCHIRPALTTDSAKSIACSLIGCHLDYAHANLVGISDKNMKRLQRIQNTLAQVVTRQRGRISISKTFKELHWLPVKLRIDFKVATVTYKLLESNEPAFLRSRISLRVPRCSLWSSADDRRLDEHPTRTASALGHFSALPRPPGWNALPYDIQESSSVSVIKSKLKAHYFQLAFS